MASLRSFPLVRITGIVPVRFSPRASVIGLTNGITRGIGFNEGIARIDLIGSNGGISGIVGIWGIKRVVRCMATQSGHDKGPARLSMMRQVIQEAEERARAAESGPTPKISLEHVTVNFARSGGPGGQNVNKLNTKVDMRFNVKEAHWLSERVREKILQMEKNRINKDGELVTCSTKTRTQKGNIDDALEKIQAIIDAACYVPPPPSEETKKKIERLAAKEDKKRLERKKALSDKKNFRRNKKSWD